MSGLSDYLAGQIMGWLAGTDTDTAPVAIYAALFDGDPTDDGSGGTEVTTDVRGAGRVAITLDTPVGRTVANASLVNFGNSDNAVSISHIAVFDAASAGNMLASNALDAVAPIAATDPVSFAIGALVFNLTQS